MLQSRSVRQLRRLLVAVLACAPVAAAEAQTFDGHGITAPPDSPDALDPVWMFPADTVPRASAGLTMEYVDQPLVRVFERGEPVPIIDDLAGATLSGTVSIGDWMVLGVALPTWLVHTGASATSGPVAGDYVVSGAARLLGDKDRLGLALDAQPQVSLPTGGDASFLGSSGLTAGGSFIGSARTERFAAYGTLGSRVEPRVTTVGYRGGLQLTGGLAGAVLLTEDFAIQLDGRGSVLLAGGPGNRAVPTELLLTAKKGTKHGLWGSASAGRALTAGVGAPALRAQANLGYAWGDPETVPRKAAPEPVSIEVRTAKDRAIRGATILVDGIEVSQTDDMGRALLPQGLNKRRPIEIQHPNFESRIAAVNEDPIVMTRPPVPMTVRIVDSAGARIEGAVVSMTGPLEPVEDVDENGDRTYALPAGEWQLVVTAPGLGSQSHPITIAPERDAAIPMEIILRPEEKSTRTLVISAVDSAGNPVEGAMLVLGGQPVATTGPDGVVTVTGIDPKAKELTVTHPTLEPSTVNIEGRQASTAVLGWPGGVVTVLATGPDGAPTDGLLFVSGETTTLPPQRLGSDGRRDLRLAKGEWTAAVSSVTLGTQERRFEVSGRPGSRQLVDIALRGDEGGDADLEIRLVDPDGDPVDGARVRLDGEELGATSSAGSLRLRDIDSGERRLQIEAAGMVPVAATLDVVGGPQRRELVLDWKPGSLLVTATESGGRPVDALLFLEGPADFAPIELGDDGAHILQVAPGTWTVRLSSPAAGIQERTVDMPEAWNRLVRAEVQFVTPEGGEGALALEVTDIEGGPIDGAAIQLDDEYLGTTSNMGTLAVKDLREGSRAVSISAPAFQPETLEVQVRGATEANATLGWGVGAVRVRIDGAGEAVPDARIVTYGEMKIPVARPKPDGTRILALGPGEWLILVSSPAFSPQEQAVSLSTEPGLTTVDFEMRSPDLNSGVVLIRVFDMDQKPVVNSTVTVGGETLTTSASGSVMAEDLPMGHQTAEVRPPEGWLPTTVDIDVKPGAQEAHAVVAFEPIQVRVRALGSSGSPVPAEVTFQGPEFKRSEGGEDSYTLRPGRWTLSARHENMEATSHFMLEPGDEPQVIELQLVAHKARMSDESLVFQERIPFEIDQALLRAESAPVLDDIADVLLAHPSVLLLEVQGHTDDTGGIAYNLDLSERRARAVVTALVERGVPRERLVAKGYGLLRPLDGTDKALNRRVEFAILEQVR